MTQHCEVCANLRPGIERHPDQKLVLIILDTRDVLLCTGHAKIAEKSGVTTFEQLRAFYGTGRRSFVPRRAPGESMPLDDRRDRVGRRSTDLRRTP